jgi:hypothetical protein
MITESLNIPKTVVCPAAFCFLDFFLLHNNAPTHKAGSVCQFFTQKNVITLYHPYSPGLSLPEYFLFPKLKMKLNGLHFVDVAEIQEVVTDDLKKVQIEEFSSAFQKLYDLAKACIYGKGAYFEYKNSHVSSLRVIDF